MGAQTVEVVLDFDEPVKGKTLRKLTSTFSRGEDNEAYAHVVFRGTSRSKTLRDIADWLDEYDVPLKEMLVLP